jgi:BNR/Asp-box repeat
MRRALFALAAVALFATVLASTSSGRDRPFSTAKLIAMKWGPAPEEKDLGTSGGNTGAGGIFSKSAIQKFRCTSGPDQGSPATYMDISCNTTTYNQDWNPDNEIAVAVNPEDPNHIVAGSNDYFYRFNNSTGARQVIVPTGFFTSKNGGQTWVDGQIPMRSGNGAGDPSPAFDAEHDVVLMAQLENTGGQGGAFVTQGDVSVSRSTNGGINWSEPVTVFQGKGAGIGPANNAVFYDKEYVTCDNWPESDFYGRCYLTTSRFLNGPRGSYAESPIWFSYSDDGGRTWSPPKEISGSHPSCTYQETGGGTDCDEDQFSYPEVASDGTLYVHFLNGQNDSQWELDFDFDNQIMVVKSTNGGATFTNPMQAAQLEDGLSDMPYSVIGRQTIWGHQIRWASAGNISVNPNNPNDITVVFADRATPNPNATEGCFFSLPGDPPAYDPCNAGPSSNTNVYTSRSTNGGVTWTGRQVLSAASGHEWFPWADHKSDGTLVTAWDMDVQAAGGASPVNDQFRHVLKVGGGSPQSLGPLEQVDVSVTHWAGQYVPQPAWPQVCGPVPYSDPPITDARGKDCNVFHGDYTGLAVDSLDRVHVVWTGLNRLDSSTQRDPYTGGPHDGYVQDAMYARRGG